MFCVCKNDPDEVHPNVNVCPVCMGHPGTLPVPNQEAISLVQRVGAALGCVLADVSKFDRKNYFYPDLPKGYQISQYDEPLCGRGELVLRNGRRIGITRIHLEEDTGRSQHPEGADYSVVDFNRAGRPLMELVTEPDLRTAEDVELFAQELQRIIRYVGASEANMDKGEMRVEVNISLRELSETARKETESRNGANGQPISVDRRLDQRESATSTFGTKVEVKNLNSIRAARLAVATEIDRQSDLLEDGKPVLQETRGWHDTKQTTFSQRSKEEAHDYRYFPEPDIPPLRFPDAVLEVARAELPELPQQRRERLLAEYGLTEEEAGVFVDDKAMGEYYEKTVSELRAWAEADPGNIETASLPKLAANYLLSDFRGLLIEKGAALNETQITPENFAELVKLVAQGTVTSRVAKDLLQEMFATGQDPSDIVKEKGLAQVSDEGELAVIAADIVAKNPQAAGDFRAGKEEALKFLVGKMMAATKGKANPALAEELLQRAIARS